MKDNDQMKYDQMYLVPVQIYNKIINAIPNKSERDTIEDYNKVDTSEIDSTQSISQEPDENTDQVQDGIVDDFDDSTKGQALDDLDNSTNSQGLKVDECQEIMKKLNDLENIITKKSNDHQSDVRNIDHIHDRRKPFVKSIDLGEVSQNQSKDTNFGDRPESCGQNNKTVDQNETRDVSMSDDHEGSNDTSTNQNNSHNSANSKKKWICDICGKSFSTNWTKKRHIRTIHKKSEIQTKKKQEMSKGEVITRKRKPREPIEGNDNSENKRIKLDLKRKSNQGDNKKLKFPKW